MESWWRVDSALFRVGICKICGIAAPVGFNLIFSGGLFLVAFTCCACFCLNAFNMCLLFVLAKCGPDSVYGFFLFALAAWILCILRLPLENYYVTYYIFIRAITCIETILLKRMEWYYIFLRPRLFIQANGRSASRISCSEGCTSSWLKPKKNFRSVSFCWSCWKDLG